MNKETKPTVRLSEMQIVVLHSKIRQEGTLELICHHFLYQETESFHKGSHK